MTAPETKQPWARHEPGTPIDQAFVAGVVEQLRADADERERRFNEKLDAMPTRWFWMWILWSAAIGVVIGLLMILAHEANYWSG